MIDVKKSRNRRECDQIVNSTTKILLIVILTTMWIGVIGCGEDDKGIWRIPSSDVPSCMRKMINEQHQAYVVRYQYRGEEVYYFFSGCCDRENFVFDGTCSYICDPDGGFNGQGDGKCPTFFEEATQGKLIWCEDQETCDQME